MLLQVLYDNIKDKSKVITRARVTKIRTTNDGAAAMTINNDVYEGDIVIGADGIHSTVRSEMWKLAQKLRPNWFDPSEEEGRCASRKTLRNNSDVNSRPMCLQLSIWYF